jgi:predicted Fe-Mo cluster-binding NifX family protein
LRICIPCKLPGGPDGTLAESFESMEVMDYYEPGADGFGLVTQTYSCVGGACIDPVEAIISRHADAVVVRDIRQHSSARLQNAGVRVLRAGSTSVEEVLGAVSADLMEWKSRDDERVCQDPANEGRS